MTWIANISYISSIFTNLKWYLWPNFSTWNLVDNFFAKMHKLLFISGNNFEISIYYYVLLKLSFYARNYSAGKLYAFWKKTNNLLQLFIWVRPLKKPAMWQGVILISSLFETRTDILAYFALYEKIDNWFNKTYVLIHLLYNVYEWLRSNIKLDIVKWK